MKRAFQAITLALILGFGLAGQSPADRRFVSREFLSEEEALKLAFPNADTFIKEKKKLSEHLMEKIENRLKRELRRSIYTFYIAKSHDETIGYALVDEEKGKYLPITFMTSTDPQGKIQDVQVLIYREPVGDQIQRKSYLHQYVGKTSQDSFRVPHDIVHIIGATISCQSLTDGVRRALVLIEEVYLKNSHQEKGGETLE